MSALRGRFDDYIGGMDVHQTYLHILGFEIRSISKAS